MKLQENVPIASLTTMRIGGAAKFCLDLENSDEVRGAYTFAREKNLPVYVLGTGANTIGRDTGFPGVIIRNRILGISKIAECTDSGLEILEDISLDSAIEFEDSLMPLQPGETIFRAFGGEIWDDFVVYVAEKGYTGVETLAAIPGTVGAAPVQNIGAYGNEVSETIFAVEVYDTKDSELKLLFPDELDFAYRHSIFNSLAFGRYFIISVFFKLHKGTILDPAKDGVPARPLYNSLQAYLDQNNITDFSPVSIASAVTAVRADKLPDPAKVASSGSFFKNVYLADSEVAAAEAKGVPIRRTELSTNPPVFENKVNTGWLVEHSGLMGKDLHGFHLNEKAALVLINDSAKSYADLAAARSEIIDAVFQKFNIRIEQEPVEIDPSLGPEGE